MDSTNETTATPIEPHKPDPRQQEFDFRRAAKIKIIERTQLLFFSVRSQIRAKALLKVIESHSRDHQSCWLSVETIRIEMGGSARTVQRAIRDCEAAELLVVTRHKHSASTFTLQWSLLIDLSRESMDEDTWYQIRKSFDAVKTKREHSVRGCHFDTARVTDRPLKGDRCGNDMSPLSAPLIPSKKPTTTEPTKQNQTTASDFEWAEVVAELDKENILAGGQSVLAASAAGASADFVMLLIDHFRSRCLNGVRAFGPGALMRRIEKARLGQSVDALWPPPCAGYLREVERDKREVEREKNRKPAQPLPGSAASLEPLERPARDCSDEERLALSAKLSDCIANLRKRGGVMA